MLSSDETVCAYLIKAESFLLVQADIHYSDGCHRGSTLYNATLIHPYASSYILWSFCVYLYETNLMKGRVAGDNVG